MKTGIVDGKPRPDAAYCISGGFNIGVAATLCVVARFLIFLPDWRWGRNMVNISSIYPNNAGCRFDFDYYLKTHLPMSIDRLSSAKGFNGVSVERGVRIESLDIDSAYVAMCHYYFASFEDFLAAFLPHAEERQGDVIHYTDIVPVIQISRIEIAQWPTD